MSRSGAAACFVLASLLLVRPALSGKDEKQPAVEPFEMTVSRVEVDVVVEDEEGNFVKDLKIEDFELYEEGKRMKIEDFELATWATAPTLASESAPPEALPGRKFILFIDMTHTGTSNVARMKPSLIRFINGMLRPQDEMMVSILTHDRRALLLQDFTSSRERLNSVIGVLRGRPAADTRDARQEQDLHSLLYADLTNSNVALPQLLLRINIATDVARNLATEQYHRTSYSLQALASVLERVESAGWQSGRKTVLFVTEGVALQPGKGLFDIINRRIEEYNAMLQVRVAQGAGGSLLGLRAYPVNSDYDIRPLVRTVAGRLNRVGATVYSIDARGPFEAAAENASRPRSNLSQAEQIFSHFASQESLNALADDTGGLAYFDRINLDGALRDIEADNHQRYLLTYTPPKHKKGKPRFYELKVKCKRPDVQLRARRGYLD